jgi:hypothetical protein|tara:strand:+ start:5197 stop:5604 length:408 start_codon:yes stop_codon:yes gene_type:complete
MNDFSGQPPIFFKWSPSDNDQLYEKSRLEDKHKSIGADVMETILQEGPNFINNNDGGFIGDGMMNHEQGSERFNETKRENNFEKMNQREMVAQTSQNPFLSSNYLEDLQVQESFLTPQNSNSENKYSNSENKYSN